MTSGQPKKQLSYHHRSDGTNVPRRLLRPLAHAGRELIRLTKDAAVRWSADSCYRLAASLAYAALFSIFPLLLLCTTAFGFVLGDGPETRARILSAVARGSPETVRSLLDQTLQTMQEHRTARGVGSVIGILSLLLGASGVFSELQASFNVIWRASLPPPSTFGSAIVDLVRGRALAFAVVVVAALGLLVSLVVHTAMSAAAVGTLGAVRSAWTFTELCASYALLALLVSAVYRVVPQTSVAWRDVIGASLLTALLLMVMRNLLSLYLSYVATYSAYGALGGVLGLMTWIYGTAAILLYGAELGSLYAERFGRRHPPFRTEP